MFTRLKAWIGRKILARALKKAAANKLAKRLAAFASETFKDKDLLLAALLPKARLFEGYAKGTAETMSRKFLAAHKDLIANWAASALTSAKQQLVNKSGEALSVTLRNLLQSALATGIEQLEQTTTEQQVKFGTHPLPSGTRFVQRRGDCEVYVIEMNPAVRTIRFAKRDYSLSFPYLVIMASFREGEFEDVYLFFRNERLRSTADILLTPCLPNISIEGKICIASYEDTPDQIDRGVSDAISAFLNAEFSRDWDGNQEICFEESGVRNYEEWRKKTADDPGVGTKISWPPFSKGRTVQGQIYSIFADTLGVSGPTFEAVREATVAKFLMSAKETVLAALKGVEFKAVPLQQRLDESMRLTLTAEAESLEKSLTAQLQNFVGEEAWRNAVTELVEKFSVGIETMLLEAFDAVSTDPNRASEPKAPKT